MRTCIVLVLLAACTTTQTPRTLGKGGKAIGLSMGGPVTRIPGVGTIPLPYPILEGRYGVSERLDVHAGTHLLVNAFGAPQLDLGLTYLLVPERPQDRSAVSVTARSMFFLDFPAPLFLPELALTWSARVGQGSYLYGGLSSVWGMEKSLLAEEGSGGRSLVLLATPLLGGQVPLTQRLRVGLEAAWIAPYIDTTDSVVNYPLPGGPGAISFKLGFSYQIPSQNASLARK